jgi:hypothetical protein
VVLERDGEDQLDRACENEKVLDRVKEERTFYIQQNEGSLSGLVTSCVQIVI